MGLANCMWCEAEIRADSACCPECGLEHPVASRSEGARSHYRKAASGGRRFFLALFAVPLMLSAAYAAHSQFGVADAAVATAAVQQPDLSAVTDPVQRGIWQNGIRAVRLALADPAFSGFNESYVRQSAGQVVSFCGTIPSGQLGGLRFVSMAHGNGQAVIEGRDPSFDTLWNRVCDTGTSSAA